MKKITFWLFALFTCWQMTAQVNVVENFNPSTNLPTGWTSNGFGYVSGTESCAGNSYIDNLYSTSATGTLETPNQVAGSNGTDLTVTFDYKIEDWFSTTPTSSGWGNIQVQYSTNNGGAWTTFFTINDANHVVANTCATFSNVIPAASLPSGSDIKLRFLFTWVSGDYDIYIDNFSATQVTAFPPSCTVLSTPVSGATNISSSTVAWNVAPGIPLGYKLSVGTTPGGTNVLNMFDVGNVTSYNLGALLAGTTYYVKVFPYNTNGQATGCTESSFTTCGVITTYPSIEPFDTFLPNACWMNGVNGDLTAGPSAFTASDWAADGFANAGTTGAFSNNIYMTGANDWVISPQFSIPATGYELKFDAAAVQYAATTAPTTPWESDDFIEVLVSSTGTSNWTVLHTYNDTNQPGITATPISLDLDAFASQTVRFAFRAVEGSTNGAADIEFSIDNFQVRLTPSCIEPLGLLSAGITSTGASVSWDATDPIPSSGYEYIVSTSNTLPTVAGTPVTTTFAVLSGLLPNTTYYVFVRANCGSGSLSPWSASISFTTACAAVTTFTQNFDAVTTPALPSCWGKVGTSGTANTQATSSSSSPNTLYMYSSSTTNLAVVKMQPVSNLGDGTHRLKFKMRANFTVGGIVEFGYLTNPMDATTFVSLTTMTAASLTYENFIFLPPAGSYSDYPAFRHTGSPSNSLLIDDVVWEAIPTCPDQTGLIVAGISATGANTSWDNLSTNGATGYEYAVTTSATPPTSGTAITSTFYIASGLTPQTVYYLHVRAACTGGAFGNWSTLSFFTGYCLPSSTGTATYVNNFSTTGGSQNISNLATGFTTGGYLNASTQFVEGFATSSFNFNAAIVGGTAGFAIWIDWNNDMILDNATEKVYNTISYGNGPFSGTISIPAGTALGNYRMRITTDWNASNPDNPCAAVSRGEFEDYTITVIAPPACAPPAPVASGVADMVANINWPSVTSAALGYEYVLNTVATYPTGSGTAITAITYAASALTPLTTYYFHVRSVCSTGTYSTWNTVTFTTVATPPVNDNCATATVLTPGGTFATNPLVGTNIGSTASAGAPAPGCASYLGGDVWYSVIVPASGNITFDSASVSGSPISDSGMAVYSGPCSTLVLVECDDDDSLGSFSKISLTNRTPGEVLYVRFWEYGNDAFGTFQVSAYDASLSAASFDTSNFVAYPNPVKDVLNLSYKSAISNVKVINLLGQEVVNAKANTNDVQVDMSSLNAGVYIVNVTVDDTVHTIKVIKE
ncbi:GEVED domain-containing protein [Flavobacterium sp.]|jgi:hypothetical protein|uniref:GEVED domain-containing protein n=1 Tax=Flavobacterium sp. TaxID=239 RepID=UPI0037C0A010